MDDVFRNMTGPQLTGLVAVVIGAGGGLLIGGLAVVSAFWAGVRRVEAEAQLKRDLVAAGMSADEIERVVRATSAVDPAAAGSDTGTEPPPRTRAGR